MRLITGETKIHTDCPTAVTLGKFDGVHKGHQKLIRELFRDRDQGTQTVVFTFQRPPQAYVSGRIQPVLLTCEEKRRHIERLGVDILVEYPFTEEVCRMEPEAFVEEVLVKGLHVKKIAAGPDFRFGYQRRGDAELLERLSGKYGYRLILIEKEKGPDGREISSSLIREELAAGNVGLANRLLGYPFTVTGEVVHGNHLGRTFGMPTINQLPRKEKLLPPNGVYAAAVKIDGKKLPAVANVGCKPTIAGAYPRGVETYVFGFEGDLYGRVLDVELFCFQRPEKKFPSVEELKAQLARDAARGRQFFEEHPELLKK